MTKTEFINRFQANTGDETNRWSKADCGFVLDTLIQTIMDVVSEGEKISFVGFGSFEIIETKQKNSVNPKTGEKIVIPASKRPKFKAGKLFKDTAKGV
jgi:DNA-binding protein HU-beta